MSLYSLAYFLFFATLLLVYHVVGRVARGRQWAVLLVGSLVFYCMMGSWQTLAYVLVTAGVTWAVPLGLARMSGACAEERKAAPDRKAKKAAKARWERRRRLVLVLSLLVPFGVLAYLKYWNVIAWSIGLEGSPTSLGLLLPLGISFYTFQSVGYLIDAYREKEEPERNFLHHLLFVTYFPQMIQGPINRHSELMPQLLAYHEPSLRQSGRALMLVGYGAMKKFVMADLLAGIIAKILDSFGPSTPGALVALAILMYSVQQYGDFSGGIDMVEGFSEILGIKMAQNFNRPYLSVSLADFWRRWHMSLGRWMRDYVFYPVALSAPMKGVSKALKGRASKHVQRTVPACVANIVVFLLVGIWHGPQLHFVVWGLYNGLVIAASDLLTPAFDRLATAVKANRESRGYWVFSVLRTFVIVNVGWYFDRIDDVGKSLECLWRTVSDFAIDRVPSALVSIGLTRSESMQMLFASMVVLIVLAVSLYEERGHDARKWVASLPMPVAAAVCSLAAMLVVASFTFNAGGGFMYANY